MSEPFRTIAERIVKTEQDKCHGSSNGCIRNIREGDCGQAGGSLVDAIAHALEDAAIPASQAAQPVAWRWKYRIEDKWQHCSAEYTPPSEAIAEPLGLLGEPWVPASAASIHIPAPQPVGAPPVDARDDLCPGGINPEWGECSKCGATSGVRKALVIAWEKYEHLFGEPPHGTANQIAALVELMAATLAAAPPVRSEEPFRVSID